MPPLLVQAFVLVVAMVPVPIASLRSSAMEATAGWPWPVAADLLSSRNFQACTPDLVSLACHRPQGMIPDGQPLALATRTRTGDQHHRAHRPAAEA